MDPDQSNTPGALDWSRSIWILIQRTQLRGSGPGMERPGPEACIKALGTRFPSFPWVVSLSSSSLLRRSHVSRTLNPNFSKLPRNSRFMAYFIRSSILIMNHSKENVFHRWNNVNPSFCRCKFKPFGFLVFFGWNHGEKVRIRFGLHSLWILKRFFDFSSNFLC